MDRVKIKEVAKDKIKGNKWDIIWPALIISVVQGLVERLFGLTNSYTALDMADPNVLVKFEMPTRVTVGITILGIIFGVVMAAYKKYILNFVRNGKFDFNDIIECVKEKWLNLLIAEILVTLIVAVCMIFFVIPGVIMSLAYAMTAYLVIDTNVAGADSLKESREMMRGYKWNLFVFYLSFIGWILLIPLTLGVILIWLFPYMTVAEAIYYDEL